MICLGDRHGTIYAQKRETDSITVYRACSAPSLMVEIHSHWKRYLAESLQAGTWRWKVYFTLILTFIQIVLALGLALLVNRKIPGIEGFRVIYLIPVIVAETVEVSIWKLMFYEGGMINGVLSWFNISPQPFLSSPNQALLCIILTLTYRGVGFWTMFYLAGLNNIEEPLYEVASIAGANFFQKFRYVTWPLLIPTTTFIVVSDTILNFLVFTPIYMMTEGGPMESTNLLIYNVYKTVMGFGDLYRGSAIAMIAFLIIFMMVGLQFLIMKPKY